MWWSNTSLLFLAVFVLKSYQQTDYWKNREEFIKHEESLMLGSGLALSPKEKTANKILMTYKLREYDDGFEHPGIFAPGRHFFNARRDIEKSKVFRFITKIPKGAALHGHDTSIVSEDFLYQLTFKENLYGCCTPDGRLKLKFLADLHQDVSCNWTLVSDLRKTNSSYDEWLRSQLTLTVENPKERYPNIDVVWQTFLGIFGTIYGFLTYKPVFEEHFYQALKELYDDNVLYLEFRGTLPSLYALNGTIYDPILTAETYQGVIEKFKKDHPDFVGARFIYGPSRKTTNATALQYVKTAIELKKDFPNLLAGFDLVGQEDAGWPLDDYLKELENISSDNISFYFHSGETDWYGSSSDYNIIDAILLGTKRIGHGYALTKHPYAMEMVKRKQIAVEVCPISNQVLMLVDDMRNHPASVLIASGFPVVISYDDPSFWSTKGLSYDFYMAFMGIASRNADLRLLKQFALNSIEFSAMPGPEKKHAFKLWKKKWDRFIDDVVKDFEGKSNDIPSK